MNAPENRALTAPAEQQDQIDLFSARGFDLACRIARAYSSSDAVPTPFRAMIEKKGKGGSQWIENPAALGNCIVAIETARSVGMSITSVMQNANVIEGKLAWSAQFQIAAINASGRFTPLQFQFTPRGRIKAKYREKQGWNDEKRGFDFLEKVVEIDDVQCVAWAFARERGAVTTRRVEGPPVSMKMAVEEGWFSKSGSKWQGEMATLMLTYRAGAFFARIYAPDIVMGMGRTAEEAADIIDITPETPQPDRAPEPTSPPVKAATVVTERSDEETEVRAEPPADDEPPVKAADIEPPSATEARAAEPDARPAEEPAPAAGPAPGEFMATTGEKQNLRGAALRSNTDLRFILDGIGAVNVPADTLEGLTKAQWKAAKRRVE